MSHVFFGISVKLPTGPRYSSLVHFFVCSEAEKNARDEQAQLKDAIEAEKVRTEEDTTTASMEIARLKDDLLESR